MKATEAYMVIHLEDGRSVFNNESQAEQHQKQYGGTIVKFRAYMPEKVEKTVWINLYTDESSTLYPGNTRYNSEEEAIKVGRGTWGYFRTFQKTVEVVE
jgi:hypothetical protein